MLKVRLYLALDTAMPAVDTAADPLWPVTISSMRLSDKLTTGHVSFISTDKRHRLEITRKRLSHGGQWAAWTQRYGCKAEPVPGTHDFLGCQWVPHLLPFRITWSPPSTGKQTLSGW
jgi:hypothetical protein